MYVAGLDLGVRPIGDWSTEITLSSCSSPLIRLCAPARWRERCRRLAAALYSTSLTSVDFPDPDTPVTQQNTPSGTLTSTLRRLCWETPSTLTYPEGRRRRAGVSITRVPARNCPVSESATRSTSAAVPCATT